MARADIARHQRRREVGVNHVALRFKPGQRPAAEVMEEVAHGVQPHRSNLDTGRPR